MSPEKLMPWIVIFALVVACSPAPLLGNRASSEGLNDGEFEGKSKSFPNSAKVKVIIVDGRITEVEMLKHGSSSRGRPAAEQIPGMIVEAQRADVDAVSGATNSSRVIMNAVQNALDVSMDAEKEGSDF